MEDAKEKIESIHATLLDRLKEVNEIFFKSNPEEENIKNYTKITSYNFISCAIESIIAIIIEYKYGDDKFAFDFINEKNKFSGKFLDHKLLMALIGDADNLNISTQQFKQVFYPICEDQIKKYITQSGEQHIFENENFENLYKEVKTERNKIAHEFFWSNHNFTAGMLVKFLKIYYALYLSATQII